jgi:predicted kinase
MHPKLILMSGLPGSGKSTLASAVASSLGAVHLNSDIVRKELSSKGKYTDDDKALVYQVLMDACSQALAKDRIVIADATFTFQHWRRAFERMAALRAVPVYWVLMTTEDAVIRARMQTGRPFESEADYHVYQCLKEIFEPFEGAYLSLASDQLSVAAMVRLVLSHIGASDQVTDSENHDQGRN